MAEMTKEVIVASCKANGGYAAPPLNDQLFLHCKGFAAIKNLEPYKEVRVLWLEQNALSNLAGLDAQTDALVSLFVQNNFIRSLTSLTARLHGLRVLNISHNYLTSLDGLASACPLLETLQAAHNQITSLEDCEELWKLAQTLTSVDLSYNRIEYVRARPASPNAGDQHPRFIEATAFTKTGDEDEVRVVVHGDTDVQGSTTSTAVPSPSVMQPPAKADPLCLVTFFAKLPLVSVIYLQGNDLARTLRSYRRNMILHHPALTYLDERPVFPEERRVVEAWGRGGETAEASERTAIREEKRAHLMQCVSLLTAQREGQWEVRERLTRQCEERRAKELEEAVQRRRAHRDAINALTHTEDLAREAVEKTEQDIRWDTEDAAHRAHAALSKTESAHRHAYEQHEAVTAATRDAAAAETVADVEAAVQVLEDAGRTDATADMFTRRSSTTEAPDGGVSLFSTSLSPSSSGTPSAALAALLQSDDAILQEMESEIEHVLYDLGSRLKRTPSSTEAAISSTTNLVNAPLDDASAASYYSSRKMTDRTALRMGREAHAAVDHVAQQLRSQQQQRRRSSDAQRESTWQRFEQWESRRSSLSTKE